MAMINFIDLPEDISQHIQEFRGTPRDWATPTAKCIKNLVGNHGHFLYNHFKLYNKMMRGMGCHTHQSRKNFPPFEKLAEIANNAFDEEGVDDSWEYGEVDD